MINGSHIVGGASFRGREKDDFYATPFEATKALLAVEPLEGTTLEPACGQGHIVKVLRETYPEMRIIATDLIQREDKFGCGIVGGVDFLNSDYADESVDNVVTNPPFALAQAFVEKALMIARKKVIVFEKIQWLEGMGRYEFFKRTPLKCVYVFSNRVSCLRGGNDVDENGKPWSSVMCMAWFVFEKGHSGEPIVRWLKTKDIQSDNVQMKLEI